MNSIIKGNIDYFDETWNYSLYLLKGCYKGLIENPVKDLITFLKTKEPEELETLVMK